MSRKMAHQEEIKVMSNISFLQDKNGQYSKLNDEEIILHLKIGLPNRKEQEIQLNLPKTNPPPAPLQFMDDSETNESSQKCKTEYSDKESSIDYLTINGYLLEK